MPKYAPLTKEECASLAKSAQEMIDRGGENLHLLPPTCLLRMEATVSAREVEIDVLQRALACAEDEASYETHRKQVAVAEVERLQVEKDQMRAVYEAAWRYQRLWQLILVGKAPQGTYRRAMEARTDLVQAAAALQAAQPKSVKANDVALVKTATGWIGHLSENGVKTLCGYNVKRVVLDTFDPANAAFLPMLANADLKDLCSACCKAALRAAKEAAE